MLETLAYCLKLEFHYAGILKEWLEHYSVLKTMYELL